METSKKIWVLGGSSGIGLELVKICLQNNYKVIASSRNAQKNGDLLTLQAKYKNSLKLLDIDASNNELVEEKVQEAWACFDGIDIWFYNAAAYEVMSIDDWDYEKFEQMNNVNYLGVIRIMTQLAPLLKEKKRSCLWLWNCSLSSYFGLPKGGAYSAPKAALVNLAQSIQPELKLENIDLQIINHGFVKTRLTSKNSFDMPQLMEPSYTAKKIFEGMNKENFEIRFPFLLSSFLRFLDFLPYSLSLKITKGMIK